MYSQHITPPRYRSETVPKPFALGASHYPRPVPHNISNRSYKETGKTPGIITVTFFMITSFRDDTPSTGKIMHSEHMA